jgi:hypothetical protein
MRRENTDNCVERMREKLKEITLICAEIPVVNNPRWDDGLIASVTSGAVVVSGEMARTSLMVI